MGQSERESGKALLWAMGLDMATSVIIPARNEEATIGAIVAAFQEVAETHGSVYVGIDADTVDNTSGEVWKNGGCAIHTDARGKGQVVSAVLHFPIRITPRVILCDGDYTGLTPDHIRRLMSKSRRGMTIGIPDWPEIDLPERVINSWPHVSGFRSVPTVLIPDDAHGYMLETQLNLRAIKWRLPIHYAAMNGLKSPFQWPLTPDRQSALIRDQEWGRENGIF